MFDNGSFFVKARRRNQVHDLRLLTNQNKGVSFLVALSGQPLYHSVGPDSRVEDLRCRFVAFGVSHAVGTFQRFLRVQAYLRHGMDDRTIEVFVDEDDLVRGKHDILYRCPRAKCDPGARRGGDRGTTGFCFVVSFRIIFCL